MTYNVFGGTLSLTQSINQSSAYTNINVKCVWDYLEKYNELENIFVARILSGGALFFPEKVDNVF